MGKQQKTVSKNARVNKVAGDGGKNHVKIVVCEKNPKTGAYVYKSRMVHKDKVEEALKGL